jgi:hypothetical protein
VGKTHGSEGIAHVENQMSKTGRVPIDFAAVHHQLQTHKHVTLQLLWEEYCNSHADKPDGRSPYSYTRMCELYHRWRRKLDVVLRQDHRAGEKMFVDWAGTTVPIYDRATGESQPARALSKIAENLNLERNHQGLGNRLITPQAIPTDSKLMERSSDAATGQHAELLPP